MKKYYVMVKIKDCCLDFKITASSLEEAIEVADDIRKKTNFFAKGIEYVNGKEEVYGVFERA